MGLREKILNRIMGRIAMPVEDTDLLEAVLRDGHGDHIEIGTLWGGTAILAAMCKPEGLVYAIDPLTGYYGREDHMHGNLVPTREIIEENLRRCGVQERVRMVQAKSYPWPVDGVQAESVLIDGCHEANVVAHDWRNARKAARRMVIFHDIENAGVQLVIERLVVKDTGWHKTAGTVKMAVYERV